MVRKVKKIMLWTVAGFVLLAAILAGVGAWMLTPSRLTGLVNRELSKRLNADVTAHNVRLDLFSTYPIARVSIDSLTIVCRPDSVRTADGRIMADARQLLKTGAVTARLDVRKLLHKDIDLQYAGVDSMRLNLVRFSPARSNWNILPDKIKPVKNLSFAFDTLSLTHGAVRFRDMVSDTDASLAIDPEASILPQGSDSYRSRIPAKASVSMKGRKYLTDLPLLLEGDTKLTFTPFALSTKDFTVKLGDITGLVTLDMSMNPDIRINTFDWKLSPFGIGELAPFSASTEFMNISGNAGYDTHDIQNIAANVALGMNDLELSRLYTAFPALTEKVPEIKNLTGRFDIAANLSVPLFPTMYVMTPALSAGLRIQADDLYLHQDREIRRVTHLMMIHSRDPLHIADLDIRASVFDNMVMLHPFDLNLDRYKLRVAGLNNFNGRMFYHVGVKDWPLMFPFGVNVKGTFGHPEIRLGSSTWKDIDATAISGDIMSGMRINLAHRLRHYLYILLDRAARADQTQ